MESTIAIAKIWSAVASGAQQGFGSDELAGGSKAPSPLSSAGALQTGAVQICLLKIKIPSPSAAIGRQAGDGIFSERRFRWRPEHLFAGVQKLR
jgi:hypothetical protein